MILITLLECAEQYADEDGSAANCNEYSRQWENPCGRTDSAHPEALESRTADPRLEGNTLSFGHERPKQSPLIPISLIAACRTRPDRIKFPERRQIGNRRGRSAIGANACLPQA